MKKAGKCFLIVIALGLCFFGMIHFQFQHSAKESLREEGIRYYRMQDYANAVECFSLALEQKEWFRSNVDRDIYYYLANGEFRQQNYENAITYYNKLLELGEQSVGLYTDLGISYMELGKYEKSYQALKQAEVHGKKKLDVVYNFCQACIYTNRSNECMNYAKKAYPQIRKNLEPDIIQALKEKNVSELSQEEHSILKKYGAVAYMGGDEEEAFVIYDMLKESNDPQAKLYLGYCLAGRKDYEGAVTALQEYESLNGVDAESEAKLAYCYVQLKQYEQAGKCIEQALSYENQPMRQQLLMEKGILLEQEGEFDAAFDCFAEYVRLYPSDAKGVREYDFLVTRISDEKASEAGVDNGNVRE